MRTFGFFYSSKKMDEIRKLCGRGRNFARQLFTGKVVEYSEWSSKFPFLPASKHDDTKLVAIGFFDHHE